MARPQKLAVFLLTGLARYPVASLFDHRFKTNFQEAESPGILVCVTKHAADVTSLRTTQSAGR